MQSEKTQIILKNHLSEWRQLRMIEKDPWRIIQTSRKAILQLRLDKLEKSMEIINNRLDTLTNLVTKLYSKDD